MTDMEPEIIICGGNGAGKSTLARALATALGLRYLDIEDYYFPKGNTDYNPATTRSEAEAMALLRCDLQQEAGCVLAMVACPKEEQIATAFTHAVLVTVPKDIRMQRIRQRALDKFGSRVQPGGDLYEQEERFFAKAAQRTEASFGDWLENVQIPVIRLDGTRPVGESVQMLVSYLAKERETAL